MSIEALRWALDEGERRDLDPALRHILLIMGNRADEAGYLYPSIDWICRRTGYSRRAVQINCKKLAELGIVARTPRMTEHGDRTSDAWQLAMLQPGLPLEGAEKGGANSAPPPRTGCATPAHQVRHPRAPDAPYTQDQKKDEGTPPRGAKKPAPPAGESTVAKCWQVYRDGIKRIYGTDYPPSASVNGKLARVVALVGKENAPGVVGYYLGSADPWYKRTQHKLDFLVRDAAQLCMQMQQAAGTVAGEPPATTSRVMLVAADGKIQRDLGAEFPIGDPLQIAREAARQYGRMVINLKPAYLVVRQGAKSSRFTTQELTT